MGLGKGFIVGLVLFIVINVVMGIVIALLSPGGDMGAIMDAFTDLSSIGSLLFGAILVTPGLALFGIFMSFLLGGFDLVVMLTGLALFISPLVAALLTGKLSESKGSAFGAWFLVCIVSAVVLWVLFFIGGNVATLGLTMSAWGLNLGGITDDFMILIVMIVVAVVNGIFYGCFSILASSEEW